ncbi:patatin-like phospholipase family protein [Rhodococcus sp. ACS1]|uniref:patatin-like phospholipase family protein n=1 Tax=Rhodococcus sp. ACS1 TaxID=2028570 RepID=UPI0027BA0567|nr:patatin-like phospholipase family protein [Rhodococcus sp. ACS1]
MAERVGLVVSGGGARGAYEAGAITSPLPRLGRPPTILVGTSAGALTVTGLAADADLGLDQAAEHVVSRWSSVALDDVFGVVSSIAGGGLRYLGQLAGLHVRLSSPFDTTRMTETITKLVPFERVHENIERGIVEAVAVAATSVATGGTVVFVEKHPSIELPRYDANRNISYVETELRPEHVLASAAVPGLFRPIHIGTPPAWAGWYVDGGLRLNMPLKPAVQMGADRLGMVSTRPRHWPTGLPSQQHTGTGEPDIFNAAGVILRAMLADRMVEDLHRLESRNAPGTRRPGRRALPAHRCRIRRSAARAGGCARPGGRGVPPTVSRAAAAAASATERAGPVHRRRGHRPRGPAQLPVLRPGIHGARGGAGSGRRSAPTSPTPNHRAQRVACDPRPPPRGTDRMLEWRPTLPVGGRCFPVGIRCLSDRTSRWPSMPAGTAGRRRFGIPGRVHRRARGSDR